MTANEIKAIVNKNNKNEDIKWKITKNTADHITLTNNYDVTVVFNITLEKDDTMEWVMVRDRYEVLGAFMKGSDRWSDYTTDAEGLERGVERAVNAFYYYY